MQHKIYCNLLQTRFTFYSDFILISAVYIVMPNLIMCRNKILNFIILLETRKRSRKSLPTKDTEEEKREWCRSSPGHKYSHYYLWVSLVGLPPPDSASTVPSSSCTGCDIVKRYQNNNKCQGSLMNKIKDWITTHPSVLGSAKYGAGELLYIGRNTFLAVHQN